MIRWLAGVVLTAGLHANDWPSFRGPQASGVADEQNLPAQWDVPKGQGVLFKVAVPGLAHSSPIIAGDRLFLTTAVSSIADSTFKPGLYGAGTAASDRSVHEWRVICLDKRTGKTLWSRVAVKKKPTDKRHIKATYANSTPAKMANMLWRFLGRKAWWATRSKGNCCGRKISGGWMSALTTCRSTNGARPVRRLFGTAR